jgi:hypothetical protein
MVGKNNGEIGIILPETDQIGSNALKDRLANLIYNHPSFKSDHILSSQVQNLSFQSFTYPNQFKLPESLSPVLEEVNKEYFHNPM